MPNPFFLAPKVLVLLLLAALRQRGTVYPGATAGPLLVPVCPTLEITEATP